MYHQQFFVYKYKSRTWEDCLQDQLYNIASNVVYWQIYVAYVSLTF